MTKDVIEQTVLVSGRIVHRGTGLPLDGSVAVTAKEGPVALTLLDDGTFALSADPHRLDATTPLSLTIRAQSRELTTGTVTESVALTPPFAEQQWRLPMSAPQIEANLARTIRGSVVRFDDPAAALKDSTVEIAHAGAAIPAATTDADGRFSFDDVVVEAPATISAMKTGFTTQTRQLLIDFSRGVDEQQFRLRQP